MGTPPLASVWNLSVNLVYFPFANRKECLIADVIGLNSLLACLVDLEAAVMNNAMANATRAVLNTSETRTAKIDFVNMLVALRNCVEERTG